METAFERQQRIERLLAVFEQPKETPDWDAYHPFWEDKHLTASTTLFLMGESAVPALIDALSSKNEQKRYYASAVLSDIEDVRTVPVLLDLFQNETDAGIIRNTAHGLANIGDKQVVPVFCEALFDENEARIYNASKLLGHFHDARAYTPLVNTLTYNKIFRVRQNAAYSLAVLGNKQAYEPILELIEQNIYKENCFLAIVALGKLGDKRAFEPLVEILETSLDRFSDRDTMNNFRFSQYGACYALGMLKDERAFEPLVKANSTLGGSATTELGLLGSQQAFEKLVQLSEEPSGFISAIEALGITKNKQAFDLLMNKFAHSDDTRVSAAIDGLGELGDARAVDALLQVFNFGSAEMRYRAAIALGKIGDSRALPQLEYMALADIEPLDPYEYGERPCQAAVEAIKLIRRKQRGNFEEIFLRY